MRRETIGVLCVSGLRWRSCPDRRSPFALPVFAGTLWMVFDVNTTVEGGVLLAMLLTFGAIAAALASRPAQRWV